MRLIEYFMFVSAFLVIIILFVELGEAVSTKINEQTDRVCRGRAVVQRRNYRGTEFESMDWYRICVDNATKTSPTRR